MSRATPQLRKWAKRLIAFDTSGDNFAKSKNSDIFQVCEKLRPPLAMLVGNNGFRTLISHALALAKVEVPALA